jgi:hypothetical protein
MRHVGVGRHGGNLVLPQIQIALGEFVEGGRGVGHVGQA